MSEIEPTINISELDLQALENAAKLESVSTPSGSSVSSNSFNSKYVQDYFDKQQQSRNKVVNIKDFIPQPRDDLNIGPARKDEQDWFGPFGDEMPSDLARYRPPQNRKGHHLPGADEFSVDLCDLADFDDFDEDDDVDDKLFQSISKSNKDIYNLECTATKSSKSTQNKSATENIDRKNMEEFLKSIEIGDDEDSDNSYIQTTRGKDSQPTDSIDELSTKIDEITEKLHDIEAHSEETNRELLEFISEDKIRKSIRIMNGKIKQIEEKLDLILSRLDSAFGSVSSEQPKEAPKNTNQ